nr:hypothetical protein Iba_chr10cCG12090 [Ipomoea batatas]
MSSAAPSPLCFSLSRNLSFSQISIIGFIADAHRPPATTISPHCLSRALSLSPSEHNCPSLSLSHSVSLTAPVRHQPTAIRQQPRTVDLLQPPGIEASRPPSTACQPSPATQAPHCLSRTQSATASRPPSTRTRTRDVNGRNFSVVYGSFVR